MRRVINFRPSLFIAVGLILGIFSFYELLFGDFWFGLVSLLVFFSLGVVLFSLKSKGWWGVLIVIVSIVIGFGMSQLRYSLLSRNAAVQRDVTIVGRVCDLNRNGSASKRIYLEDCVDESGVKYSGRVAVVLFDDELSTGEIVTLRGEINSLYPLKGTVDTYSLRHNIRYELNSVSIVARARGKLKLDETVRRYIYNTSVDYAPKNGDVVYALLTGDRSALSVEKETYFKSAGIIHLLAVSGLHVGFVVAVFCIVLKRLHLHPMLECGIVLVPLLFYAYICQFSPSVLRAIVMLICSYAARAVIGRYDLLTSLSWAVVVILIISPFNLFDVGFQLSALSVYGISTAYLSLNRRLVKCKLNRFFGYIVNSAVLSLTCSVATFFTMQVNFGYAPILGVFLNIIAIPVVAVTFVLGWIGMLPWVLHYVLYLADILLNFVVLAAKWIASLSFSSVFVPAITLSVVVMVLWLFVLGEYVNLKKLGKIIAHSVAVALLCLCVGLSFVKIAPTTQAFVAYGYDSAMCVVTTTDGEAAIVGDFSDSNSYSAALNYVNKYKITSCTLYFTEYSAADSVIIADALENLPITSAYKMDFSYNNHVDEIFAEYGAVVYQQMKNTSRGNSVEVTSIFDGELRAVRMKADDLCLTQVLGGNSAVDNYLALSISSDIYVLPHASNAYSSRNYITLSRHQSELIYNYGANKCGNFTITQKGDTIKIKFR